MKAIIDMAVEAWRFRRVFDKAMSKLDAGESSRYIGQFNWFIKKVEAALKTAGMRIVNVEGQAYDPRYLFPFQGCVFVFFGKTLLPMFHGT